jgi:hypothetical protein
VPNIAVGVPNDGPTTIEKTVRWPPSIKANLMLDYDLFARNLALE